MTFEHDGLICSSIRSICETLLVLIWPLYVKAHFGWEEHQYGRLILTQSFGHVCVLALFPRFQRHVGMPRSVLLLGGGASASLLLAFLMQSDTRLLRGLHVLLALCSSALLAALNPCLRALGSTMASQAAQGRSFAALNMCSALGAIVGSLAGTRLYQLSSSASSSAPPSSLGSTSLSAPSVAPFYLSLFRGGALPTTLAASLLAAACALLSSAAAQAEWRRKLLAYDPLTDPASTSSAFST